VDLVWVKLLGTFVLPLGMALLLLLAAVVTTLSGRTRTGSALVACVVLALWLLSTKTVSSSLVASLEQAYPAHSLEDTPSSDAILVLGGGIRSAPPPRLPSNLGSSADRILHAARLYRAGKAPWVVAAGGPIPWVPESPPEARAMAALLEEWGVPRNAILLETHSRTTAENCRNAARLLGEHHIHKALLVTSAMHMRRALAACRAAGLHVTPSPTDFESMDRKPGPMDWRPDPDALSLSSRAIRERLGFRYYRWRGWIGSSP